MSNPTDLTPSLLISLVSQDISRFNHAGLEKPMEPVMIWGAPGIGKTDIVNTIATMRNSRTIALHLSQYDPNDLKGIPVCSPLGTVSWVPSSYLPQQKRYREFTETEYHLEWIYATDLAVYLMDSDGNEIGRWNDPEAEDIPDHIERVETIRTKDGWTVRLSNLPSIEGCDLIVVDKAVVFLDELSAADVSTQNAALQLVLDRRVNEYEIPHAVPVLAAGNRESDGAFVMPMSHPLGNRFQHYTMTVNAEDWEEWAVLNRKNPIIISFIKNNPSALFDYDSDVAKTLAEGRYGFATPRSVTALADQYKTMEEYLEMVPSSHPRRQQVAERMRLAQFSGRIGHKWASQLISHLQMMTDLPSINDIANGVVTEIDQIDVIQSYFLAYSLVYRLEHLFEKYYDLDKNPDEQDEEWTEPRDNIISFVMDNLDDSCAVWMGTMIFQKTGIHATSLRGDAFLRYTQKYVSSMRKMNMSKTQSRV